MSDSRTRDVIVIGGGPAGATTAGLLAREGRDVLLLERETFPRFRIGESLMPATYHTFKRLGVLDKLEAGGFVRKESVRFYPPSGKAGAPFFFDEVEPAASAATWQVDRGRFDSLLLEHAVEQGARLLQPCSVVDLLQTGNQVVGVVATDENGARREIPARVVVDATGQNALISRRLRLRKIDDRLQHMAFFTRYQGAHLDDGRDAGATLILHTRQGDSWFWFIPLPGGITSVGVVGHIDYLLKGRAGDPQQVFDEEKALCPALGERLTIALQTEPVQAQKDFSYISQRIAGDGWVMVGDAFGFLDPIYSSGVFLALKSAEFAADSIHAALAADDLSAAALGRHGQEYVAGMEALRRLIYAYYDRDFSFGRFLKAHPGCRDDLVNLLVGNVYRRDCSGFLAAMDADSRPVGYQPLHLSESGR
jgi:flavin-dependent dehydrogenase